MAPAIRPLGRLVIDCKPAALNAIATTMQVRRNPQETLYPTYTDSLVQLPSTAPSSLVGALIAVGTSYSNYLPTLAHTKEKQSEFVCACCVAIRCMIQWKLHRRACASLQIKRIIGSERHRTSLERHLGDFFAMDLQNRQNPFKIFAFLCLKTALTAY